MAIGLIGLVSGISPPAAASAEPIRVATFTAPLSRKYPGELLYEILNKPERLADTVTLILKARPDVLVLTRVDYDADAAALGAFADLLEGQGLDLPHLVHRRPNTGTPTNRDIDGDGRLGEPEDAQSYGWFSGQGGLAVLSRWPVGAVTDLSTLLWRDLPQPRIAQDDPAFDIQRLSTTAHWIVPVQAPVPFDLMVYGATTPVFDGPKDRNGRRNADETQLWINMIQQGWPKPFVLAGLSNLDPLAGQGLRPTMARLLDLPQLQDPLPGLPTAQWDQVGRLRVSYVLPSRDWAVQDARIAWPQDPEAHHALVWVDVTGPGPP